MVAALTRKVLQIWSRLTTLFFDLALRYVVRHPLGRFYKQVYELYQVELLYRETECSSFAPRELQLIAYFRAQYSTNPYRTFGLVAPPPKQPRTLEEAIQMEVLQERAHFEKYGAPPIQLPSEAMLKEMRPANLGELIQGPWPPGGKEKDDER